MRQIIDLIKKNITIQCSVQCVEPTEMRMQGREQGTLDVWVHWAAFNIFVMLKAILPCMIDTEDAFLDKHLLDP